MNKIYFSALWAAVACFLLTADMTYAALAKIDDGKTWTAQHGDTVSVWASGGAEYAPVNSKSFGIVALNSEPGDFIKLIDEKTSSFSFKIRKGEGENNFWYADLSPFNGSATQSLKLNSAENDTAEFGFYFDTPSLGFVKRHTFNLYEYFYDVEERQNPLTIFDLQTDNIKISASSYVPVPSAGLLLFSGTLLLAGITRKRGCA